MLKIGFEKEWFALDANGNVVVLPTTLANHADGCGFLFEARGAPATTALKAKYLLLMEEEAIRTYVGNNFQLLEVPFMELDKKFLRTARRTYGKAVFPADRGNMYGLDYEADDVLSRAGLHIHFSDHKDVVCKDGATIRQSNQLDMPKIIRTLDEAFEAEIKDSHRLPGFYQMKSHGGFEYRSLPNNVDLQKVVAVIDKMFKVSTRTWVNPEPTVVVTNVITNVCRKCGEDV